MIVAGAGSAWAQDVTYDFTGSGWSVSNGTLTNGTVSFTGAGSDNFKMNNGYFMMGKSGAYINFPTYDKAVEKIVVTGRSGASASTKMNVFVGETAVSTETTGCTGTNTYNIASDYQAAGTVYTLKVTSSHNAQVTKIEVFFASESGLTTPTFTPEGGNYIGAQNVKLTCATEGASIYYTLDGSTPTNASTLYSTPINVSETTTINAIAYDATGAASNVATATYNILSVDHAGTEADPYSVSDAIKYISTLGSSSSPTEVYVKGIVSQVDSYNETYKSITYWISDDGETTTQMEVYSGKGLNNADFASVDDIQVGDEVTVCGTVKLYKQTPEFDYNNYLV